MTSTFTLSAASRLLWPIEGDKDKWPAYRAEQAHLDFGEGAAWDLGDQEGLPILAPADGTVIAGTGNDPQRNDGAFHAGNVTVLECSNYRFHLCHQQKLEVKLGEQVKQGDVIGHIGHTGTVFDSAGNLGTVAAAHLHLWTEERVNGQWRRVWPIKVFG